MLETNIKKEQDKTEGTAWKGDKAICTRAAGKKFLKRGVTFIGTTPRTKNTKTNLITKNLETGKFDFCLLRAYSGTYKLYREC